MFFRECIFDYVEGWYENACILFFLAKAYTKILVRRLCMPRRVPAWKIRKVLLFREEANPFATSFETERDFHEVPISVFSPSTWKEDAWSIAHEFGWPSWRMEVRYTFGDAKFRSVVRPEGSFRWPPASDEEEDVATRSHRIHGPRGILSAHLVASSGVSMVDITSRLRKYAGVLADYGNNVLRAHDIFPYDDGDWMADKFSYIRIIEVNAVQGIVVRTVNFVANDAICGQHKKIE